MEDPRGVLVPLDDSITGSGTLSILANVHSCMVGITTELKDLPKNWEQRTFIIGTDVYILIHRVTSGQLKKLPTLNCTCGQSGVWHRVDATRFHRDYIRLISEFENLRAGGEVVPPKPNLRRTGRLTGSRPPISRPPSFTPSTQLNKSSIPVTHDQAEQHLLDVIDRQLRQSQPSRISNGTGPGVDRLARLLTYSYPGQVLVVVMDESEVINRSPEQILTEERQRWVEFRRETPERTVILLDVARPSVYDFVTHSTGIDLIIHRQNYFH